MAHFAKLGIDNVVTNVVAIDNIDIMTRDGVESEEVGIAHLIKHHGHENWKKCSYNTFRGTHKNGGTPFRANYPGIGDIYNSEHDIFHSEKPYGSWTLNTSSGIWEAPITRPTLTDEQVAANSYYEWNEAAYQSDNTQGWVLVSI